MFSEMQGIVFQLSLKVSHRRCCCPLPKRLTGAKVSLTSGPVVCAQIRPISSIKKLQDIKKLDNNANTSGKSGKNSDQRSSATFQMFWNDSLHVFGNVLAVSQEKEPAAKSRYASNARQVEFAKTRGRLIDARKLFDEQTALMYGSRLTSMPEELDDLYVSAGSDRKKKGPGVAPVPPEVHDDLYALGTPDGSMEIAADAFFSELPEFRDSPLVMPPPKPIQEPTVRKVRKREPKKIWIIEDEDAASQPRLPVRNTESEGSAERASRKEKPVKSESPRAVVRTATKRVPPVSQSNFRIVQLKKESDLKSLGQSPLLNKLRPNYVDDACGFSLPTPMVLQISPEDLASVALTLEGYPSVTTILDVTMAPESRARLDAWKRKKIEELGADGFLQYQQQIFANGKGFHTAVESVLHGADLSSVEIPKPVEGFWESLKPVLKDVSDAQIIEEKIMHPFLCYKGVTDCIVRLDGTVSLVEWKTSGTKKDTAAALYDNPLQVAAYMGAVNFDEKFEESQLQIANGAVVVAYASGEPASVIHFDLNMVRKYWAQWLRRLQQFWRLAAAEKAIPQRSRDE